MRFLPLCLIPWISSNAWGAEATSMANAALQTLWALLIVVGLILALYALARKRFALGGLGSGNIKVIEMRPLLPKATLALVEVRGREYLLGISGGNIQLLADLQATPPETQPTSFSQLLREKS
jgi:flagellar protein FliO/FliZ